MKVTGPLRGLRNAPPELLIQAAALAVTAIAWPRGAVLAVMALASLLFAHGRHFATGLAVTVAVFALAAHRDLAGAADRSVATWRHARAAHDHHER